MFFSVWLQVGVNHFFMWVLLSGHQVSTISFVVVGFASSRCQNFIPFLWVLHWSGYWLSTHFLGNWIGDSDWKVWPLFSAQVTLLSLNARSTKSHVTKVGHLQFVIWSFTSCTTPPSSSCFVGLAYQGKDIVFRFIIEYSSLMDFGPWVTIGLFLYEDFWNMTFWLVLKLEILVLEF